MNIVEISSATLKDIYEKIPSEKWEEVLDDMRRMLAATRSNEAMLELTATIAKSMGEDVPDKLFEWPVTITWVDDGKGECTANNVDKEGNVSFSTKVSKGGDNG